MARCADAQLATKHEGILRSLRQGAARLWTFAGTRANRTIAKPIKYSDRLAASLQVEIVRNEGLSQASAIGPDSTLVALARQVKVKRPSVAR
jgi:hypothetical protein